MSRYNRWFLALLPLAIGACTAATAEDVANDGSEIQAADDHGLPVLVTWNLPEGSKASLDVVLRNGHVIGPCVDAAAIQREVDARVSDGRGYLFSGLCVSPDIMPAPDDIAAFQVCAAVNNDWANAKCARTNFHHTHDVVHIKDLASDPPESTTPPGERGHICTTGSATSPAIKNVILRVFGGAAGPGALRVAKCESGGAGTNAKNGQYLGLFQMGSGERARYGHDGCAETQAAAAFKYFQQRGWGPWSCKP